MADTKADPTRALFNDLCARRDALQAKAAPLRAQRDIVAAGIAKLREEEEAITVKIRAIEHPDLIDVMKQIARLAKALGGKTLSGR